MKRISARTVTALTLFALTLPCAGQFKDVGVVDFPTSTESAEAQRHFLRGVAILHSFAWKQAIEQFQTAQKLDPDFAMAFWGETLCYNHPLFSNQDPTEPRKVLTRLGSSPAERASKAETDREKGFLGAVEVLWGDGESSDRKIGYYERMLDLYDQYPKDDEVATFYALSLLSASGSLGDSDYEPRHRVRAGSVALDVFKRRPNHPGAAHYVIHSFDDPIHAPLALEAANRYAEIAPAASHARHMPTHIFIQHGMWKRVSSSNVSAYQAARDLWEPGDAINDMVHALDWGQYGDLQHGDYEQAAQWIKTLERIIEESDGASRAVQTLPMMRARFMVETEKWHAHPLTEGSTAWDAFASGLAAVRLGQKSAAKAAHKSLIAEVEAAGDDKSMMGRRYASSKSMMEKEIGALIALSDGKEEKALKILAEAVAMADERGLPRGAVSPVKPAHELQGEVLLEMERWDAAIAAFTGSLERTANRALSLRGLARARLGKGDETGALDAYRRLATVWEGRQDTPGIEEALAFLKSHS
ncbi:MAG: hypothetical protein VYE73_13000 [Acidobacteriota bacterium]|nr:hypothetical protein [Acidobacteriota bacterium]